MTSISPVRSDIRQDGFFLMPPFDFPDF